MGGRIVTCLAVGIVLVAAPAAEAQGVAYTFTELRLLVRPGETISVVDAAGREMTGRIVELWPSKLALRRAAGTHEVLERDVQTIWQRRGDSLRNGALWGLGSGAALGGLAALAMLGGHEGTTGWAAILAAFYGGIGAGIGVGVDALVQSRQVIYARPAAEAAPLGVAPIVGGGRAGVAVSFRF